MLSRVRTLVTVIALTVPQLAAAQGAPKRRMDPVATFLQQDKYTYCDAKILSALWKQSVRDAKARVGLKLQGGGEAYLSGQLASARVNARRNPRARCTFGEAGFSYDDVAKLAKLWKMTEADAKALAEDKILDGNERLVRELVRGTAPAAQDPVATFLQQDKYTYCDVKLLSARWRASAADAKARIGVKLQTGNEAYLASELAVARKNPRVRCSYDEAGFSYADVETLAKRWRLSVGQTKVQIEQKVRAGHAQALRQTLAATTPAAQDPVATFLQQDKYTYCDAKMIAGMWKQSVREGKAFIGGKLALGSAQSVDRTLERAHAFVQKNRAARCTFAEAGLSYQDAVRLAKLWSVTATEAKAITEEKIAFGEERMVRAQLQARTRALPPPPAKK